MRNTAGAERTGGRVKGARCASSASSTPRFECALYFSEMTSAALPARARNSCCRGHSGRADATQHGAEINAPPSHPAHSCPRQNHVCAQCDLHAAMRAALLCRTARPGRDLALQQRLFPDQVNFTGAVRRATGRDSPRSARRAKQCATLCRTGLRGPEAGPCVATCVRACRSAGRRRCRRT